MRMTAVLRGDAERVMPLELFFDLVFVLAVTQCTALMAHDVGWAAGRQGLLVLGVLGGAWGGCAWLTSGVDPEEGAVLVTMVAAMAALVVAALCVPPAFGSSAGAVARAFCVVRFCQTGLFLAASRDDPPLRRSVA